MTDTASLMKRPTPLARYRLARAALDLRQFTVAEIAALTRIPENTVYSFLSLLSPQRVRSEALPSANPGRPRKLYTLTSEGVEYLVAQNLEVAALLRAEGLGIASEPAQSNRKEDELLGETRDRLIDRIEEVGREALEKGKQVAGAVAEELKEAEKAGLTASNLAEKVREVGRLTKDIVKDEVKNQGLAGASTPGSQSSTVAGLTSGGATTPSSTTGTTGTGGLTTGSRGRNTLRETVTPVEQPELSNKR